MKSLALLPFLLAASAFADSPATQPASVLYEDPTAVTSATVKEILPNSTTTTDTFQRVTRVRLDQGVLIVEWGGGAVTLLPREFVGSLTLNKRSDLAPTTSPAH